MVESDASYDPEDDEEQRVIEKPARKTLNLRWDKKKKNYITDSD